MSLSLYVCICCFFGVLDFIDGSERTILWKLKTPVFLRGNATISCMIPENDTPGHMAWTKDGKLIGLNNASRNSTKYLLFTIYNKNYMMFSLVIKDIGLEDLNLVYKCESGFSSAEGIIPLNEETFVALPTKEDISKNFTSKEGLIHIDIEVTSVYPRPRCIAAFKGKDITRYSMTSYSKGSKFYSLIFYLGYQTDKCGDITTSCIIGKNEFTILEIVNEVKNCKQLNTAEITDNKRLSSSEVASIIVGSLIVVVGIAIVYFLRNCRRIHAMERQTTEEMHRLTETEDPEEMHRLTETEDHATDLEHGTGTYANNWEPPKDAEQSSSGILGRAVSLDESKIPFETNNHCLRKQKSL